MSEQPILPSWRLVLAGLVGFLIVASITVLLLYLSEFWQFRLWGREGLFGLEWLRPQGNIVGRELGQLLRGSGFGALGNLDILLWVMGSFLALTWLDRLWKRVAGWFAKPADKAE